MDWDEDWTVPADDRKSYFTMSEKNNYAIWGFLKECFNRKLIYRDYDVMPWCVRCGTGISEMEMKDGYKSVSHKAAFVKFKLDNGEWLLVWTTTPWTIPANLAISVNPHFEYSLLEVLALKV
jgi:isoleucyl-tRNA synthetase